MGTFLFGFLVACHAQACCLVLRLSYPRVVWFSMDIYVSIRPILKILPRATTSQSFFYLSLSLVIKLSAQTHLSETDMNFMSH